MGKKLIIKGADFSENAIVTILPSSWDYEAKVVQFIPGGSELNKYYIVTGSEPSQSLVYTQQGGNVHVELENGTTVKITDNLFAVYNSESSDWVYLTENEEDLGIQLKASDVYAYTAPNTFESSPRNDFVGAKANVKAGDIVIYKGSGGSSYRLIAISNTVECEYVAQGTSVSKVTGALEVQADGVMYFDTYTNYANPLIKVLR